MSEENILEGKIAEIVEKLDNNKDGKVDTQDVIVLALQIPGIRVDRESFFRREFANKFSDEMIEKAIKKNPAKAGIPADEVDKIANDVINFERACVSGISAALGVPGGIAMAATVPVDVIQYYGYTLRATQKLLYLYGFPELKTNKEGLILDTHTVNEIILCLGIMYGVAGANNAVKVMAKALATGVEKKLLAAALTKGTFYPFVKQVMKWFGVKLTKTIFAKTVKDAIPVVGGLVGGGITFVSFKPCCNRLKETLKDTTLSNPDHVDTKEEEKIYQEVIDAEFETESYEDNDKIGKYIVKNTKKGFIFELKAGNGDVIATSELYKSKATCVNGVISMQLNAPIASIEDQTAEDFEKQKNPKFELSMKKSGEYTFRLKARNGKIVASGGSYKAKKNCMNGIKSVRGNAGTDDVVIED